MRENQQPIESQSCHPGLIYSAFTIGTTLLLTGINTLGAVIGGELTKITNTTWGNPVSEKRVLTATSSGSSIGFFILTLCFAAYIAWHHNRGENLQTKLAQWFHAAASIDACGGAFVFPALANFIYNKVSTNTGSLPQSSFVGFAAWLGSISLIMLGYLMRAGAQCGARCTASNNSEEQPIKSIPKKLAAPNPPSVELTEVVAFQPNEQEAKPLEKTETVTPSSDNARVFQMRHRRQTSSIGGEPSAVNPFKHQRQSSC